MLTVFFYGLLESHHLFPAVLDGFFGGLVSKKSTEPIFEPLRLSEIDLTVTARLGVCCSAASRHLI
jgi:hypothetical protein|tara:strand:+ start:84 stop:281 length:198 start_codon:yes stop_codon:yes gene_type:complete